MTILSTPSTIAPLDLLQTLVRFNTTNPPGNEAECIRYLDGLLSNAGFETRLLSRSPHRLNLVTRLPGQGNASPLLLYGHVDVITTENQQWQHPPFSGDVVDGYLWGRGALDMKGGIVMMLTALLRAKAEGTSLPGDVILALVCDEEQGSEYGAKFLVNEHSELFAGVRYAIGEFGGFSFHIGEHRFYPIMVAEKQPCWLQATVRGAGGHGALSSRDGAMARLAHFLTQLERRRLPVHVTPTARLMLTAISQRLPFLSGLVVRQLLNPPLTHPILTLLGTKGQIFEPLLHHTVNATMVSGGEGSNILPSEITLGLDARLLPGFSPDNLISELRQIAGDGMEFAVEGYHPGAVEPDMGLFGLLGGILKAADPAGIPIPMLLPAATDGRFFARLGIQTYGFLPMLLPPDFNFLQTIHGPNERIAVGALSFGADAIYQLLRQFGHPRD